MVGKARLVCLKIPHNVVKESKTAKQTGHPHNAGLCSAIVKDYLPREKSPKGELRIMARKDWVVADVHGGRLMYDVEYIRYSCRIPQDVIIQRFRDRSTAFIDLPLQSQSPLVTGRKLLCGSCYVRPRKKMTNGAYINLFQFGCINDDIPWYP